MDSEYAKRPGETGQEYMERILKSAMEYDPELRTFNEAVGPGFVSCDAAARMAVFSFTPKKWMLNQDDIVHGGITSTLHDICMGQLAKFYLENKTTTVTAQLNVEFIRAISGDRSVRIHAYCEKYGRKLFFGRSQILDGESGALLSSATALYL